MILKFSFLHFLNCRLVANYWSVYGVFLCDIHLGKWKHLNLNTGTVSESEFKLNEKTLGLDRSSFNNPPYTKLVVPFQRSCYVTILHSNFPVLRAICHSLFLHWQIYSFCFIRLLFNIFSILYLYYSVFAFSFDHCPSVFSVVFIYFFLLRKFDPLRNNFFIYHCPSIVSVMIMSFFFVSLIVFMTLILFTINLLFFLSFSFLSSSLVRSPT